MYTNIQCVLCMYINIQCVLCMYINIQCVLCMYINIINTKSVKFVALVSSATSRNR